MITLRLQQLQRNVSFLFTSAELILEIISQFAVFSQRSCQLLDIFSHGKVGGVYGTRSFHPLTADNPHHVT